MSGTIAVKEATGINLLVLATTGCSSESGAAPVTLAPVPPSATLFFAGR